MTSDIIQLFVGLYSLYYFSNLLIDNGSLLASKYNISKTVIGLTVVAFGTSLPELIVSMVAVYNGEFHIVVGNVLGSNIANIGLVIGLSSLLYGISCKLHEIKIDLSFLCISTILFSIALYFNIMQDYNFDIMLGVILLALFSLYIYLLFRINKSKIDSSTHQHSIKSSSIITFVFLASMGLSFGSQLLIDGAIGIASLIGLSSFTVGATIIALGTSLPELATSLNAAKKNEFEMLLGNIFGSNIINIVFVFGISLIVNNFKHSANTLYLPVDHLFDLKIFLIMTVGFIIMLINSKNYYLYTVILLSLYSYYIYGIL